MTEHDLTLNHDAEGWNYGLCAPCGWMTGPVPGFDIVAEAYAEHVVASLTADELVRLAAQRAPQDEPHIIKVDEAGWVMRHPLRCRLGDLFACPIGNAAARQLTTPPGPAGEYEAHLTPDDQLAIVAIHQETTTR